MTAYLWFQLVRRLLHSALWTLETLCGIPLRKIHRTKLYIRMDVHHHHLLSPPPPLSPPLPLSFILVFFVSSWQSILGIHSIYKMFSSIFLCHIDKQGKPTTMRQISLNLLKGDLVKRELSPIWLHSLLKPVEDFVLDKLIWGKGNHTNEKFLYYTMFPTLC